jgi:ATP-binding cassette subfamily B protein
VALRDVSLELRAGEVVALAAENGSGKTTLAKLLCGLYRPTEGSIRGNGTTLGELDRDALRRQVGVIFQDFLQYQLTAGANVAMGRHEAFEDHAAVVAAAELAGAHDFVSTLPAGTTPSHPGVPRGSGAVHRRVAAGGRGPAFFSDSSLLVLDEPTAALDPRGEHELFESVRALAKGRTVVLISHRFSTVKSADRIYVIDDGRIAASGTHDELMAAQGLYAEIFTLQASDYVGAEVDGRNDDAAR